MELKFDLNQPLLEQPRIKEFLNLPSEDPILKVSFEQLLRIAQAAIRAELVACDCDENELLGLRLEYVLPKRDPIAVDETYSVEWHYSPQHEHTLNEPKTVLPTERDKADSKLPISGNFLERFAHRLDEASIVLVPESTSRNIYWSFRSAPDKLLGRGDCCVGADGVLRKKINGKCNGDICGGIPERGEGL